MPGERILIVDDNAANVVLLSFLLTTNGYDVRSAADASETIAILRTFDPQLILMDVQLPGMDGLELTRKLKADPSSRRIVVVALTAHAMKADEERARAAGCDGYLSKPIDTRTLPATVAGYLGGVVGSHPRGEAPAASPAPTAAANSAAAANEANASSAGQAVVLVVDDQAPNRALIRAHLGSRYLVREAIDGASALEMLKHEQIDLILLDVMMPHMSGFALCRLIKQRPESSYLPVILLTSLGQQEDRITGLAAGADDFLTKPVNRDELLLRVQTFIKLRQQDGAIRRQLQDLAECDRLIRMQLEELQALDSLKDELVSLLVHDMRNPLGGIAGFLDTLQGKGNATRPDQPRNDVRMALEASSRLRETLDDILQVRLLESGTVRIHREMVEANALVKDAIASVHGAARARQIDIASRSEGAEVPVVADRKLVRRAIENLLTNAVKYSPVGGVISAAIRQTGGEIEFEIADQGTSISDEVKDHLFEKFGAVEAARGGARRGVGLGLYLVKLVATVHGGRATSRNREGGGTAFTFSLPRGDSAMAASSTRD